MSGPLILRFKGASNVLLTNKFWDQTNVFERFWKRRVLKSSVWNFVVFEAFASRRSYLRLLLVGLSLAENLKGRSFKRKPSIWSWIPLSCLYWSRFLGWSSFFRSCFALRRSLRWTPRFRSWRQVAGRKGSRGTRRISRVVKLSRRFMISLYKGWTGSSYTTQTRSWSKLSILGCGIYKVSR